jgi:MFS family permease
MSDAAAKTAEGEAEKGAWSEIFGGGLGLYSTLVIGGVAMQATQMLVIAIIMPTIVADIGGADYYTWTAMLYTIGAIVGGASTGAVWARLGARRSYVLGATVFALGTVACALAPGIGALIAARTVQGWAGGLVAGSGMALITSLYSARLRTRIIAMTQGTFTACHLSGPVIGGMFAAMNWWRGSFWVMVPFMLAFAGIAYARIPEGIGDETRKQRPPPLPLLRLGSLAVGVCCIAAAAPAKSLPLRLSLIVVGIVLIGITFRLDKRAATNLFPSRTLSLNAPIGLGLWILAFHGMTQTSVNLFLPLLLQVVHGVSPVFVNFLSIIISCGWTIGTFTASGWSGARERVALMSGPVLAFTGLVCLTAVALQPALVLLAASTLLMGLGIGIYNVHLVARVMAAATSGEQRSTAAALTSVRSLGTAFGAAIAGVVASTAGLGDATQPQAVGHAVVAVYMFCWIPFGLAAAFMFRFVRITVPHPALARSPAE